MTKRHHDILLHQGMWGSRGGVEAAALVPSAVPVTAWQWAALLPTPPFCFDLSYPEICILSSYCMFKFKEKQNHLTEKDKSYAPKDE